MSEDDLLKIVRAQEDQIRFQILESVFFWDAHGTLLLTRTGSAERVSFTRQELQAIKPVIATHNHPSGTPYHPADPRYASHSFSLNDVKVACLTDLREVRVVSPKYRSSLRPSAGGWEESYFEAVLRPSFEQIMLQVRRELIAEVQARKVLASVAGIELPHLVWSRLAPKLGLQYARYED